MTQDSPRFSIVTDYVPTPEYRIYYNYLNDPTRLGLQVYQTNDLGPVGFKDLAEAEKVRDEYEAGMHRPFYVCYAFSEEKDAFGRTWIR